GCVVSLFVSRDLRVLLSFPTRRSSDLDTFQLWSSSSVLLPRPYLSILLEERSLEVTGSQEALRARFGTCRTISAYVQWISQAKKDRKSTRLNSSHDQISYAVFCLKKKK